MGLSFYIWDEETAKTMFHLRRSCHQFLGCAWDNFHWLSLKKKNNQWQILCKLITAFEWRNQEKTAALSEKESVASWRKCSSSHIRYRDGQNLWVEAQIAFSRTLFDRFSPLGLYYLSKLEKMVWWSKIVQQWWGGVCGWWMFLYYNFLGFLC